MNRAEFDAILAGCIADRKVSRGERRALRDLLDEQALDDREAALLRSRAFAAAADAVDSPKSREVLSWLDDVVDLLVASASASASAGSVRSGSEPVAYFAPHDDCVEKIVGLFRGARATVDVCVFTITDNRIARAIDAAQRRGVRVRIVTDNDKSGDLGSDIRRLEAAGIAVAFDDSGDHMHHKFAIFDGASLLTGSYNWTRSASEHNHENFIVTSEPRLLAAFTSEFERLWARYA